MESRDAWKLREFWKFVAAAFVFGPLLVSVAPALIVPAAIYSLLKISQAMKTVGRMSSVELKEEFQKFRHWAAVHWIIFAAMAATVITIALFFPIFYLEKYVHTKQSRETMHFLFQIITGNWGSPPFEYSKKPFLLSASLSFAIVLNLLALGLITLAIRRITRGNSMNRHEYDSWADAVLKTSILAEFPDDQKREVLQKLNKGFVVGREKLRDRDYMAIPFPTPDERRAFEAEQTRNVLTPG